MDFHTKGSSHSNERQREEKPSKRRSPSPVADAMEGVEYTGRSGKPRRLGNSEYDRLRREGRCFNCKRRGHISTACLEDKELSKKAVGVARASSSRTKERRKSKKTWKEESNSEEESSGVDTPEEDSDSGKD
jgi:hypothetical protein